MVHLQLQVVPAPGALAQPLSMSLSADKFQVLLAGKIGLQRPLLGLAMKARLASDWPLLLTTAHAPSLLSPAELKQAQTMMTALG